MGAVVKATGTNPALFTVASRNPCATLEALFATA